MNQVKNRLKSLGLIDRAFGAASDDELIAARDQLVDDHLDAFEEIVGPDATAETIRSAIAKGRLDGTMESIALILSDACLADIIDELGDHADHPSSDQLREVLPAIIERHGKGITQLMLATTVAGDAPAAAIIRDLLKNDDLVKLPPSEPRPITPILDRKTGSDEERAALKAKRKEQRKRKQREAQARREQQARAKHR
ncbi:MAG: hypothetical protein CSA55_01905 [Ilumatobacter coccineus]|uniref:Uncharacterized protein n=1 Tax=Ilumatobacter coccineus TaxID=467094 RepID=A0A2G6KD18_9ACTN|nr:MAG: hypothetical protein CSA55_01905 [Ilumatobacter coccineus]